MKRVRLNTKIINDWISFHNEFKSLFGFPDFYGMNMDAWIDCMSSLNDANAGISVIILEKDEPFLLEISDTEDFKSRIQEIFETLIECTAFVNQRYIQSVNKSVISIV